MSSPSSESSSRAIRAGLWTGLLLLALFDLLPLVYMGLLSLGGSPESGSAVGSAWARLFKSAPFFGRWFVNSAGTAILTVAFHLIADSMAAFALAKWNFRGRGLVFALIILAMMVPRQATLPPLFLSMSSWGLADTYAGLILPNLGDVIGIFLLRQYMVTIPDSLLEAARMDGASLWGIYTHVILPLSKPALAVMGVLAFQRYWGDFFWPQVILQSEKHYTLPVGVAFLSRSEFGPDLPLMATGACAAAVPALIIFLVFRRAFFEGFRGGAVK